MSKQTVLLLRSADEPDPYEAALAQAGFAARSTEVLKFEQIHLDKLRQALEHPKSYDGLIFTSPRAVEALAEAMPWLPAENVLWHSKSIFAVGPRTAEELRAVGFEPEGEEGGSAEMLTEYITSRTFQNPLLFLCGDRRRDDLPDRLQTAGIAYEEICVYRTFPESGIEFDEEDQPDWIVLFSPSGLDALDSSTGLDLTSVRIAAIGPTTAAAAETRGWKVDAVAEKPSPASLAAAIRMASDVQGAQ